MFQSLRAGYESRHEVFFHADTRLKPALQTPMRMAIARRRGLPDAADSYTVRIFGGESNFAARIVGTKLTMLPRSSEQPDYNAARALSIAAQVLGPTLPSASRPCAAWNSVTAVAVIGPNDPSGTRTGWAPSLLSETCNHVVLCGAGF